MEIRRDKYLNDLVVRKGNGMIKVVTGVRRCGKTFLVFDLFVRHLIESGVPEDHIIALALDDRANARYQDVDTLYDYLMEKIDSDRETYYVLLDEIQYAITAKELRSKGEPPALYGVLNGLLHRRNVDVYVTGSNSRLLSTDVMTEFRGRGDEVRIHPLTFAEFMQAFDGDRQEGWAEYVMYGGLPLVLSMRTPEQKASYLAGLFDEVYLSDVVERNHLTKSQELEDLVDVLASSIGSLTNPSKIEATFRSELRSRLDADTVKRYLGHLEEAFLVSEATRYDVKGRRYIGTPKKYYFEDMGLRNARLGFRQIEESHIMENIIYNELRIRGFAVDVGVVDLWESVGGKQIKKRTEIDFVCNLGSRRYYIQSAFSIPDSEKMRQESRPLVAVSDSFKKIIVVKDPIKLWRSEDGVVVMGLREFLLDPDSLDR